MSSASSNPEPWRRRLWATASSGLALFGSVLLGCATDDPDLPAGHHSSSIVVLDNGEVAVCDPDQGSVSFLEPGALAAVARVDVGDTPTQLLVRRWQGREQLLVTTQRSGELVAIDPATHNVEQRLNVCAGPAGMALGPDGWLGVACEWQGEIRGVSSDLQQSTRLFGLFRPRAVGVQGEGTERQVASSGFVGEDVALHVWSAGKLRRIPFAAVEQPRLVNDAPQTVRLTPTQVQVVTGVGGGIWLALLQYVANTEAAHPRIAGSYGGIGADRAVLPALAAWNPRSGWQQGTAYDEDNRFGPLSNGPVAISFARQGSVAFIAHEGTADVSEVDLRLGESVSGGSAANLLTDSTTYLRQWACGTGPAGMAAAPDGTLYVDNRLDNSVSRIDPSHPGVFTRLRTLPQPLSAAARAGRRAFVDARNVHLTPAHTASCASCHPGGGEDGLVWFLQADGITPRLRRTQHLGVSPLVRAHADETLHGSLHWDGEFTNLYSLLQSTVPNLLGGDALLLDAIEFAAFVREGVPPPVPPTPTDPQQVLDGAALFDKLGCDDCHSGPQRTDDALHAPFEPMTTTPGDTMVAARTPSLRGVFLRQPLFHDGRAANLQALRTTENVGVHFLPPQVLDDSSFAALLAYLRSL